MKEHALDYFEGKGIFLAKFINILLYWKRKIKKKRHATKSKIFISMF